MYAHDGSCYDIEGQVDGPWFHLENLTPCTFGATLALEDVGKDDNLVQNLRNHCRHVTAAETGIEPGAPLLPQLAISRE